MVLPGPLMYAFRRFISASLRFNIPLNSMYFGGPS
jgi:hypothetical protein